MTEGEDDEDEHNHQRTGKEHHRAVSGLVELGSRVA